MKNVGLRLLSEVRTICLVNTIYNEKPNLANAIRSSDKALFAGLFAIFFVLHSVALHSVVLHSDSGSSLLHGTRESEELLQDYSCLWIMNCIRTVVRRFQRFHQPDLPSPDTDLISRLTYAAAHTIFHTKNSRAKSNLPNGSAPDDRPISTFFVFVRQ